MDPDTIEVLISEEGEDELRTIMIDRGDYGQDIWELFLEECEANLVQNGIGFYVAAACCLRPSCRQRRAIRVGWQKSKRPRAIWLTFYCLACQLVAKLEIFDLPEEIDAEDKGLCLPDFSGGIPGARIKREGSFKYYEVIHENGRVR